MDKRTIAVLFGGQSSEHEISCVSAITIISNIKEEFYNIVLIGITQEGKWIKVKDTEEIKTGSWRENKTTAVISPDATQKGILTLNGSKVEIQKIDVIFPVLHGLYGEDGTVQGLFELAGIPYVGCGVLASAVSMDKLHTKVIVNNLDIRQAKYVAVMKSELNQVEEVMDKIEKGLDYPLFIKPSNAGSSKGVSKALNRQELETGLFLASKHDKKMLVEEAISGREIECAILGGQEPKASGVGEILTGAVFYDYDAKYNSIESKTIISPELKEGVEQKIKEASIKIFNAVDGFGLSRVDFFLEKGTDEVVFNEINTLPGFTNISMYPMLWEAKGISKEQLIEKLIQSAFTR
jgi:D-alanine-D-alanine ligase